MADEKISQLADAGAPQDTDQLVLARSGSTLSLLFSSLKAAIPGGVTSVFTRTGAVTAQSGDYTAAQVTNAADKSSGSQQAFTGEVKSPDFATSGLTGATQATRYVGATTSGAPVSGTFAVGDFIVARNGHLFVCTGAGSPGTWVDVGSVSNQVTSVFSRTGAVVATSGDYNLNQIGAATGDYSINSNKLTSVKDPTAAQDAATKNYVDSVTPGNGGGKGHITTATAANTPADLSPGANGTVLTADSSQSTGLKYAAPVTTGTALPGSPADGQIHQLRLGSSPYDFLALVYDATYGHWVSPVFLGTASDNSGLSTTNTGYTGIAASGNHGAIWPQAVYINAGLTLQLRVTSLANESSSANTGSISAIITGMNIGGADSTTLTAGTVVASTNSATRIGIDSGWVSVTPSSTTDLMRIQLQTKTTAGTFSYLIPAVTFRWIG